MHKGFSGLRTVREMRPCTQADGQVRTVDDVLGVAAVEQADRAGDEPITTAILVSQRVNLPPVTPRMLSGGPGRQATGHERATGHWA